MTALFLQVDGAHETQAFLNVGRHVRFNPGGAFLSHPEKKRERERKEDVQRDEKETANVRLSGFLITALDLLTSASPRAQEMQAAATESTQQRADGPVRGLRMGSNL